MYKLNRFLRFFIVATTFLCLFTNYFNPLVLAQPNALAHGASLRIAQPNVGDYKVTVMTHSTNQPPSQPPLLKLNHHVSARTGNAKKVKRMDANQNLSLTVGLPLNHQDELEQLIANLNDPNHPSYHQFLTPRQFQARFHPTPDQIEKTKSLLKQEGLSTTEVKGSFLKVKGKATDIERFFNTEINHYTDSKGNAFYSPSYELQVPASSLIQSVHGLESGLQAKGSLSTSGSGYISGSFGSDIRKFYNIPSGLKGKNQVIAIVMLDTFRQSDIDDYIAKNNAYNQNNDIPAVPMVTIPIDGGMSSPGSWENEAVLDVDLTIGTAPYAKQIRLYQGSSTNWQVFLDVINEIANPSQGDRYLPTLISNSWGISENVLNGSSYPDSENNVFHQMAVQGQTFFSASGDRGAYEDSGRLSVMDPASQPYVVSVGGTLAYPKSDGTYDHETVWNSSGGGVSGIWSIPAWQKPLISSSSLGSTSNRNIPDVALNSWGYQVYMGGNARTFGGTSASAPIWTAIMALANEQRQNVGLSPLGFLGPILYQLAQGGDYQSVFHDISNAGNNGYYPSVPSYDNATGLGSLNGASLIAALSKTTNSSSQAAFGGMYGYRADSKSSTGYSAYPNWATGTDTCPTGYQSQQVFGTANLDWPIYYCYKNLKSGESPDYDFGGSYGYGQTYDYGSGRTTNLTNPNPLTGTTSCPATFQAVQSLGSSQQDWNFFYCIRSHQAGDTTYTNIGGFYGYSTNWTTRSSTPYSNPLTGSDTCGTGFQAVKMLGTLNLDAGLYSCMDSSLLLNVSFGGMYGYHSDSSSKTGYSFFPNWTTGSGSCPQGYSTSPVYDTHGYDWPLYYCYRPLQIGETPDYDFGGSYSIGSNAPSYTNSVTGAASCPSGFNAVQALGSAGTDSSLYYCIQPHSTSSQAGSVRFGGFYGYQSKWGTNSSQSTFANPITGKDSCNTGFQAVQMLGADQVDSPLFSCTAN